MLILALPPSIAERPMFLAHGFYQMVAGCVAIVVAAHLTLRGEPTLVISLRTAAKALAVAIIGAVVLSRPWRAMVLGVADALHHVLPATLVSFSSSSDAQGALAMLPTFQVGLTLALWVAMSNGRRRTGHRRRRLHASSPVVVPRTPRRPPPCRHTVRGTRWPTGTRCPA